ncbi:GFA family protein [Crenobacter cavernae]|uniref:GFA family protein n=1 Tax=Crenobacter cavernae TaxID=2290923 RepID=UPI001419C414|nr:GFA family protein [Crenobacter cavernae]
MSVIGGGCLCGAIRYRVYGEPYYVTHCHCISCRKASGAAFVTWFTIRLAEVEWQGEPMRVYHSSAAVERGFCPNCGATLSYQHASSPGEVDLTVCSLDDPQQLIPEHHTWWSEHLVWVTPTMLSALPVHLRARMGTLPTHHASPKPSDDDIGL